MKSKLTAIRSNPMPAGGMAATQPVAPTQTPVTISELVEQLTPVSQRFRMASSPLRVPLDPQTLVLGDEKSIRIVSVGLGYLTVSEHNVVINIANSGGGAQTATFSAHFPWNLLVNTAIQINGGETSYSCSGRAALSVWARNRKAFWRAADGAAGLNPGLVRMTFGANLTPTASAAGSIAQLGGQASVSVAAGTNGNLTLTFYTVEKLAHSRDTLLGALPLQNNSTFAQLTRRVVGSLVTANATNQNFPLFNAGAGITSTLTSWTSQTTYYFWGIPADASLYQPLIQNSYQVIEAKSLTAAATGPAAITYNIPENQYVEAAHIWAMDNNGAPVSPPLFTRLVLQYNAGSVVPVLQFAGRERAMQFADYGADVFQVPGYRLWDGDNTSESLTTTDDAGWVDAYAAATPQLVSDLDSTVVVPITYNITREAIVAGAVQTLGG